MLAGSRWSTTALTVGAGLELRGGAFPQEEERTALGGEKNTGHIFRVLNIYIKLITTTIFFFLLVI